MLSLYFFDAIWMKQIIPGDAFQIKLFVAQIVFAAVKQKRGNLF